MITVKKLLEAKQAKLIFSLSPDQMVMEALKMMTEKNTGAILMMEGDRLVGIFSERDYARKGIMQGREAKTTVLRDVMTADVYIVTPEMDIEDCMKLFRDKRIRHLPVMIGDKVTGIVSIGDVVHAIIEEQKVHISFLEQYITGRNSLE